MHKKIELILLLALLAGLVFVTRNLEKSVNSERVDVNENTIIIDPGHGGKDPGKVGANDVLEKDVNLQIAKKVKEELEKEGYKVIMTREKDEMLCDEKSDNKKTEDMKARVEFINQTAPVICISIHQNSYTDASVHGAQVFYYSHSQDGERAAEIMQESLLSVDTDNTRKAKANDTYYLLKRTEVPTIIVECGFLSNWEEAEQLINEEYQKELAEAIVKGTEEYLSAR